MFPAGHFLFGIKGNLDMLYTAGMEEIMAEVILARVEEMAAGSPVGSG